MSQRKTEPLKHATPTGPLAGDLGLLATAVILRGRRALEQRSPKTLESVEKLAANQALRNAFVQICGAIEKVATAYAVARARFDDLLVVVAQQTIGRARTLLGALMSKLPGR